MPPDGSALLGSFVSRLNFEGGIGRLVDLQGRDATVEYFVSPADESIDVQKIPVDEIQRLELERHTRVHYYDRSAVRWLVGRIADSGEIAGAAIGATEPHYIVQFPGKDLRRIPRSELRVRWARPVAEPTEHLAARVNATSFWHEGRASLTRELVRQRAAFRGLTGLASASIELHQHQFNVVRTILHDPVQRYLLADEVGLGKTVEAGAVLRQFLLDHQDGSRALVVVPPHLIHQWEQELESKFFVRTGPDARVSVHSSEDPARIQMTGMSAQMLIVDEAHLPARNAHSADEEERATYEALRIVAAVAPRVLLLSATPVLTNEDGFLAMLHLLDPGAYPLEDRDGFRFKIRARQELADSVHDLHDEVDSLFLEERIDALHELLPEDEVAQTLCSRLRPLIDEEEEPERATLIAELRTHIAETYRLDRRMLRTRREAKSIEPDLPNRTGLEIVRHDDPLRHHAEAFIEGWRELVFGDSGALERPKADALLRLFLDGHLSHPRTLQSIIQARESRSPEGLQKLGLRAEQVALIVDTPHLEGEAALLRNFATLLSADDGDPRLEALSELVREQSKKGLKCIVFVDQSAVAQSVWSALSENDVSCELRRDFGAVDKFLRDPKCVCLVCDRRSEEGMNLQGAKAVMIHYDLPLSPQRVEQRLGRLDRIGGRYNKVKSFTFSGGTTYEDAWTRWLDEGVRVFRRSIAPLQYILEEHLGHAVGRLIDEGAEVFDSLREQFVARHGLEKELKAIRSQEALDSIDEREEAAEAFDEALEVDEDEDALSSAVRTWLVKRVQFREEKGPGGETLRYRPTSRTLVPVHQFATLFRRSLRWEGSIKGEERYATAWLTYDRDYASRHAVPLARVGNPLVEEVGKALELDDRGVAYAFWRYIPHLQLKDGPELYFRFDFVGEADLDLLEKSVGEEARSALGPSLRRRADEAFPPIHRVVWLDRDFEPPSEDAQAVLHDVYEFDRAADGRRDVNISARLWPQVDALLGIADWASLCREAHKVARERLRVDADLDRLCVERAGRVGGRNHRIAAQFQSRLSRPNAIGQASDEISYRLEAAIGDGLRQAVRSPRIRLDTVGAVVVSSELPKREDE